MAIENTAGDVQKQVELLTRHLVQGGSYSALSFPSEEDRDRAIAVAEAEILQWFASSGYNPDTSVWSAQAKDYVSWYNALGAAYRLELAHTGLGVGPAASTRADTYFNLYQELRKEIESGRSFTELGIPRVATRVLQGSFTAKKAIREEIREDEEVEEPIFERGQFEHPLKRLPKELLERL